MNDRQCKEPEDDDFFSDDDQDDEIFGYECMGCGHIQDQPGECNMCCAYAVSPMYF